MPRRIIAMRPKGLKGGIMVKQKQASRSKRVVQKTRKLAKKVAHKSAKVAPKPVRKTSKVARKIVRKPVAALDLMSLPGPETIVRKVLPNGIVVLVRENFLSPSVVALGSVWAGGLDESEEQAGLASLAASCLMRGTQTRSFHQIYDSLESAGASLSYGSGMHTSSFYSRCLAEDLGMVLELAADTLRHPTFPADELERLRGEYLTHLAIREQDTGERAHMAFAELIYPGHPYAHDEEGTIKTVQALTREALADFHAKHFGPEGMIITITGAVHSHKAISLVEKLFGDWKKTGRPARSAMPPAPKILRWTEKRVLLPGKSQADLVMGAPGPSRLDADYLPAMLGNNILGVFGMYGRIGDAVREAEGLAYYSMSSMSGGLGPGPWMVMAGVNPKNMERACELIRREIGRFTASKVSRVELADSQASIVGRMPLQLESNEGVAGAMMNIEIHDLGLDYYQRFPGQIRGVTAEQIMETARRYLHPDRLAMAVAGPGEGE
jgi:zinc protease